MGMHLIYVLPHNDWTHRGQETQHWLMWKLTAYKITHWKLPFPKSANVRLSQTCKRVISFLITLFEPWDKETDDNYLPCFIYMVPNSVLHPIPKNYWEYCYRTFSHIGLFLLVLLSLSFFSLLLPLTLTHKSLLLFLTFCSNLYHYLIIVRLVCRDTGHVHGGKEGGKTWWQPTKARFGGFPAGSWMRQQQRSLCLHRDVSKTSWISSVSSNAMPGDFSQEVSFPACRGARRGRFSSS